MFAFPANNSLSKTIYPVLYESHFEHKVDIAQFHSVLILYSVVQPQSLTSLFYTTKEYSDMTLYMGGKIAL